MKLQIRYIYLLASPNFLWRAKIGIAQQWGERLTGIRADLQKEYGRHVLLYKVLALPTFHAYQIEQAMLKTFEALYFKMRGSGGTEWRWSINLITGLFCYGLAPKCHGLTALAATLVPLPLDFALLIVGLWLCSWSVVIILTGIAFWLVYIFLAYFGIMVY